MICDFHSHLLPQMDDGSQSPEESIRILKYLHSKGLETVCATPHYLPHRESIVSFLDRRADRARALARAMRQDGGLFPRVILGAEVRIEPGMERLRDLRRLAYAGTDCILLEFPYKPYQTACFEEVYNLCFTHKLRPFLAHLNRYLDYFSADQMESVLEIRGAVVQLNLETFASSRGVSFFKSVARECDSVFGTDVHGDESLAALEFDRAMKQIRKATPSRGRAASPLENAFLAVARPLSLTPEEAAADPVFPG